MEKPYAMEMKTKKKMLFEFFFLSKISQNEEELAQNISFSIKIPICIHQPNKKEKCFQLKITYATLEYK